MLRSRFGTIANSLDEQIDPAIRRAAEAIADGARSRVPDAPPLGRGLIAAIHVERVDEGAYAVVAGSNEAFYGHIIENGSVNQAPRPFLVPAFEAERNNVDTHVRNFYRDL